MTQQADLDIIVYGASGFTGRLVCEYLYQQYGAAGEINWAMAGRSEEKLAQVRRIRDSIKEWLLHPPEGTFSYQAIVEK